MALASRMFREAVVWKKYLDYVAGLYTRTPVSALDQDVLASLRIGAVQLLVMRTPAHAAVSATVEAHSKGKTRGLVNAVLRRVASHEEKPSLPLHIRYSHPEKLVDRWQAFFGVEKTVSLLEWNNSAPELGGYAFSAVPEPSEPGKYLENYRVIPRRGRFKPPEGFYIQDESTAVAGRGMALLPGKTILEIGAAPGGKTAHLAHGGTVYAVDSKPDRMARWQENSRRLQWRDCFGISAESGSLPFRKKFSRVIADVPCTNTGVYRRRFDARWNYSEKLLFELVVIQRKMLADASAAVEDGGILVYSTCSIEPEENQGAVEHFEATVKGFRRIEFPAPEVLVNRDGLLSYFPPDKGIDGIFAAAWKKENGSGNEE